MSKRPTDVDEPPAKKRGGAYIEKDDASDDEIEDKGSFQAAPEEVLKTRRILKARRGTGAPPPTPTAGVPAGGSSNPFAGISLAGSNGMATLAAAQATPQALEVKAVEAYLGDTLQKDGVAATTVPGNNVVSATEDKGSEGATLESKVEPAESKEATPAGKTSLEPTAETEKAEDPSPTASSQGFAGFASSTAPFANFSSTAVFPNFTFGKSTASDGIKTDGTGGPISSVGGFSTVPSIFGSSTFSSTTGGLSAGGGKEGSALAALPPETKSVTGEEGEATLWAGEGTLYEFQGQLWKERGRGDLKINRAPNRPARFVMRQRGGLNLLMNANLRPDLKATPTDGRKGASFQVANFVKGEELAPVEVQLQTFAFRLKDTGQLDALLAAIEAHKHPSPAS